MKPVILSFNDFSKKMDKEEIKKIIEGAFGKDSLGIILVKDVPGLLKLRKELLFSGRKFIYLPDQIKKKYEHKKSYYAVGWSYGKEKMKNNKPDYAKGSYYANPLVDRPTKMLNLIEQFPGSYTPNIWPEEVPEFQIKFKQLGKLIYNVGLLLLKLCDKYTGNKGYPLQLSELMRVSKTCKGRFLHYYPSQKDEEKEDDASCGWHCDSGCLTGLISALYFDENNQPINKPKNAGLFIKDRKNNLVKVDIPENCIAFQIGEIIQILTGSLLIATPHCVKSAPGNVTRNTLAIFMDTSPTYNIKVPMGMENDIESILDVKYLPKGVPELKDRFKNGMSYGKFLDKTYKMYYNM